MCWDGDDAASRLRTPEYGSSITGCVEVVNESNWDGKSICKTDKKQIEEVMLHGMFTQHQCNINAGCALPAGDTIGRKEGDFMVIALLTDFGLQDSYVGVMKAVMRGICTTEDFIDITHAIQPQSVREGALILMGAYTYFPRGTVFLVVVDPGVGSARRPIAVEAAGYYFVAPDNGVLSYALSGIEVNRIVELANPAYRLPVVSQTFHGRDIFAPAAAHLASGVNIEQLGPALDKLNTLPTPDLSIRENRIGGEVIHIDRFGNVITSIGAWTWLDEQTLRLEPRFGETNNAREISANGVEIVINHVPVRDIARTYSQAGQGELLALIGSSGFLELAVNQGNGALELGAKIGDPVEMRW